MEKVVLLTSLVVSLAHEHHHEDSLEWVQSNALTSSLVPFIQQLGPTYSSLLASAFTTLAALGNFFLILALQLREGKEFLNSMLGFACGAILGDVMLHILPSISLNHTSSFLILGGILLFYSIDRGLSHDHTQGHNVVLLILADILHNTTDGMAIGASFYISPYMGISTTLAILFHEIAHETGDFIALIQAGYSLKRTLGCNLVTGVGSLLGAVAANYWSDLEALKGVVLPIVVGNFLYIALSSMMGSLKEQGKKGNLFWEVFFFIMGVIMIYLLESFE